MLVNTNHKITNIVWLLDVLVVHKYFSLVAKRYCFYVSLSAVQGIVNTKSEDSECLRLSIIYYFPLSIIANQLSQPLDTSPYQRQNNCL
jgi:hypothetical protein